MDNFNLDDYKLSLNWEEHIVPLLRKCGWTKKQIKNITEEQCLKVVEVLDNYFQKRKKIWKPEFENFLKENKTKYNQCMRILSNYTVACNTLRKKLEFAEHDWEIEQIMEQITFLETAQWKSIEKIMGPEDFKKMMEME